MSRATAEERSASYYRAAQTRMEPPAHLSARARNVWREVVGAKPVDWFDHGSLRVLGEYCEVTARLERVWRMLREVAPGSSESAALMKEAQVLGNRMSTGARQLRLTVAQLIEVQNRHARERAPEATQREGESVLLGGSARWNKAA